MSSLSLIPEDKRKEFQRKESAATVYSSSSRLNLLTKRKRMNPLAGDMSSQSLKPDRSVTQRVLSAKTHRVKQLQNQLADAQYHLQELSNENRVLRAMQKKQEIALQRYENSNAELPQVLSSHTEEIRIQQLKYKQLKQQMKETLTKLKERDMQLQQLRDEHQHLLDLSKDRNLLEREKLQSQLSDLQLKVQQQNETISTLQRRLALEAKNFKHQLQAEINKHKDTRHDLDLAINNADKLSTIIEMKEKMIYTARQGRVVKSPVKSIPVQQQPRKYMRSQDIRDDDRGSGDQNNMLAKMCENSRSLSSALSHDEETSSSAEPRSRYAARSRLSNSTRSTSNNTRKSSKGSDDIIEIAKTVQDGMADLAIFDEQLDFKNASPDEVQKKLDAMKADLINKIKTDDSLSRKSSALRRRSTDESIEEQLSEVDDERPKSRGRRHSNVSFYDDVTIEENTTIINEEFKSVEVSNPVPATRTNMDKTKIERKLSGKPIETYCKDIIHDIEKSSKVIDKHMREYTQSRFNNDTIVEHLQAVDKINELVNAQGEIPPEALSELNNNFNMISDQVFSAEGLPVARKRSVSGRRSSRVESRTNVFGDSSLSNQDLLNDLLGKK
ncbi:lebercilin-like isoform X1 [Cydia pomonella]|uniref:lebercilin-like isoform X1 n=2 Tax=Cydia pomonella TaxID=82600 RepID=UPI002ADDF749|nr:lebercilin-like isoform X1 [Cydia pomonella]